MNVDHILQSHFWQRPRYNVTESGQSFSSPKRRRLRLGQSDLSGVGAARSVKFFPPLSSRGFIQGLGEPSSLRRRAAAFRARSS